MEILLNDGPDSRSETGGQGGTGGPGEADRPNSFHYERPRLSSLLAGAVKCPVVEVCAGAGYGKTSAVRDFVRGYQAKTVWIHLSQLDVTNVHFWENFTHAVAKINAPFAKAIAELGFPDSVAKLNSYFSLAEGLVPLVRRLIVVDDFHFVEDPFLIRFIERALRNTPVGTTVLLLSRTAPSLNTADMVCEGSVFRINEDDLRFTEEELSAYFDALGYSLKPDCVREVMRDTEGWAFALNFVVRCFQKAPGYKGYIGNAFRANVFRLMETEVWDTMSGSLQVFMLRLSLVSHLSSDFVSQLAGEDAGLLEEMEKQNAYLRLDQYVGEYLIHPLFHEFLAGKQQLLPEDLRRETCAAAAKWCEEHGFRIDALSYYEKNGDYDAIVNLVYSLPVQIPADIARYVAQILDRAPIEAFDTVEFLAVQHVRSHMCQGLWEKAASLAGIYEKRLLSPPEGGRIKWLTLSRIYYSWGFLRSLMCTTDDVYDFDTHALKFSQCMEKCHPEKDGRHCVFPVYSPGAWLNLAGSPRKGSVDEFAAAFSRVVSNVAGQLQDVRKAEGELMQAEMKFFRGDTREAGFLVARALDLSRQSGQGSVHSMALFYALRLAMAAGSYAKAEEAAQEIKAAASGECVVPFAVHDVAIAWYLCAVGFPDDIPVWLKKSFSPYVHAGFAENFANQAKARFCYATAEYSPLLSYTAEMRERESCLFGRVEMLAMEACARYRMREKSLALAVLEEAYLAASPNEIIMPFVEMGKDMRTVTAFAMKEGRCQNAKIPKRWLEDVNRRSALYAKHRSHVASLYRDERSLCDVVLSAREADVLDDLAHGLSRAEIAASRDLSVNTVKMMVGRIHLKLGTENLADLIRVAVERKMIRAK